MASSVDWRRAEGQVVNLDISGFATPKAGSLPSLFSTWQGIDDRSYPWGSIGRWPNSEDRDMLTRLLNL